MLGPPGAPVCVVHAQLFRKSLQANPELLAQDALPLRRDRDRAGIVDAAYPAALEPVRAKRRSDGAREVRRPFAPVKTRPAKDAGSPAAAASAEGINIDADAIEQLHAFIRDQPGIVGQLRVGACDQRIRKRDPEAPGKMVI